MTRQAERFKAAVAGLRRGDFSPSAPLFANHTPSRPCSVLRWLEAGWFGDAPDALQEAFTCACFLDETDKRGRCWPMVWIWSAIHEPRPAHGEIIEELLRAGARLDAVDYPTGAGSVDRVLRQYGAGRGGRRLTGVGRMLEAHREGGRAG